MDIYLEHPNCEFLHLVCFLFLFWYFQSSFLCGDFSFHLASSEKILEVYRNSICLSEDDEFLVVNILKVEN